MILRGMREQCGSFPDKKTGEQIDWHNVYVSVTKEQPSNKSDLDHWGESCEEYKIKGSNLDDCFGKWEGIKEYEKYKGTDIKLYFDQFKNVIGIVFLADTKKGS